MGDDGQPSRNDVPSCRPREGFWSACRRSLSGASIDYTEGALSRAVLLLAIPMVVEMSMESLFAVCDIFFVAKLGADAVTAVGLTESLLSILYAVAMGLSMSTIALVARRVGEKDFEEAAQTAQQSINLGLILSTVIALVGGFFAPELLGFMGAEESVLEVGTPFTRIMFMTNGVIFLLFLQNAIFRGAGDPAFSMRTLMIANGMNLVLDPILIFGLGPIPALGLTGAAVATSIGRGTGVLYQIYHLRRGSGRVSLAGLPWRLDRPLISRLARVSIGGIGQFLIQTTSWVASIRLLAGFGTHAVAGYTIAIRIIMFSILPAFGIANAAATLVGQNLGANKPERAEKAVWLTGLFTMTFLAAVSGLLIWRAGALVRLFTNESEVLPIATTGLTIISYGFVFYAWGMTTVQSFNGAGDTRTPTWVNLFCFWLFQIPAAWILAYPLKLGPSGVFWGVASAYSISAVVGLTLFRQGRWKEKRV